MTVSSARSVVATTLIAMAGMAVGCSDDEGGGELTAEEQARAFFGTGYNNTPELADALNRLILTINGTPQPGVTVVPDAAGGYGSVGIDGDGDGVFEETISGRVNFNDPSVGFAGGGVLIINDIQGAAVTSVDVNTQFTVLGPASVYFGPGTGSFSNDDNIAVDVPSLNVSVAQTLGQPVVQGVANFTVAGSSGTATFEEVEGGGWRIVVTSEDFDGFTIP